MVIELLKEFSERSKNTETSDKHKTEQLNILGVMHSYSETANLINALTNIIKVNKEVLDTHHKLRDESYNKLLKLVQSIDVS